MTPCKAHVSQVIGMRTPGGTGAARSRYVTVAAAPVDDRQLARSAEGDKDGFPFHRERVRLVCFAEIAERFSTDGFAAVTRALGALHAAGELGQDSVGRHCLAGSAHATTPPSAAGSH